MTVQQPCSDSVCFHAAVDVYSKPTGHKLSMPHFR